MRTGTMVLKQGEIFVVSDERGDIGRTVAGAGLYYRDTRFLSDYQLLLNDELPDLLDSSGTQNTVGMFQFGNPLLESAAGQTVLPNTIGIQRYRVIDQGMTEQIQIHNYNPFPVSLSLTFIVSSDFRDIFDVRGFRRMQRGRVLLPRREENEVVLGYRAPDGHLLETVMRFSRTPDETLIVAGAGYTAELEELRAMLPGNDRVVRSEPAGQAPRASLLFRFELEAQSDAELTLTLTPRWTAESSDGQVHTITTTNGPLPVASEPFPVVETNNEIFNSLLDRSLRDLRTLITPFPGGRLVAAGIPWFVAPFGRDSLITALQMLMFSPAMAVETLRYLARQQGTQVNPWTGEEPGKILHEQRFGEMARLGEVPHVPYYGTVDATPLFVLLFGEVLRWSGSRDLFDEFREPAERAIAWINRYGDSNGDGFVDYGQPSRGGLVNQGWKDSDDSLQCPDGSPVATPIALVEVQGYVYRAKRALADAHDRWGDPGRAEELRREAEALRRRFEEQFWSEEDQFYGQAIDGTGRLVTAISSNPGHCLFGDIVSPERAAIVAERLRAADMYSGWGIRTLSSQMPHYNPMSYHNGSVWPHDNALIAAGLRRYGFDEAAAAVFTDLVDAATHFPYGRLPELFCGFSRESERYTFPIAYPVSCSPQAWAAGTLPYLLQVVLGLEPDAATGQLTLRPYLPDWLDTVRIRGMQFAGRTVDLTIRGRGRDVEVTVDAGHEIAVVVNDQVVAS